MFIVSLNILRLRFSYLFLLLYTSFVKLNLEIPRNQMNVKLCSVGGTLMNQFNKEANKKMLFGLHECQP